ncbi:hypothetical protein RhiirA5_368159 [Rhizophagus irregularis]|uniref:Uncharacterized protein n=1 Tax=Rhizophagus irregularis TaxID=588596 RepID=A0A2N0NJH5_9GLOM|nr:hypothetical protein RhiirA5_368159 [Rhizophagus irregularis]
MSDFINIEVAKDDYKIVISTGMIKPRKKFGNKISTYRLMNRARRGIIYRDNRNFRLMKK